MGSQRLNITIPDDLNERLQQYRDRINVSAVCQEAIAREVSRLDAIEQVAVETVPFTDEDRTAVVARIARVAEQRTQFYRNLGYQAALAWARDEADEVELRLVAQMSETMHPRHMTSVQGAQNMAIAQRAFQALKKAAQAVVKAHPDKAGRYFDEESFTSGVELAARTVWNAVAGELGDR